MCQLVTWTVSIGCTTSHLGIRFFILFHLLELRKKTTELRTKIMEFYFFENENGNAVIITHKCYRFMIQIICIQQCRTWDLVLTRWRHCTHGLTNDGTSKANFVHQIILRNSEISWPPCSPDLTPPEYFFGRDTLRYMYTSIKPQIIQHLKDSISSKIWWLLS